MRIVEQFVTRAAPRVIWNTLIEVTEWPQWTPTVTRIEPLDDGVLRIGSRFRVYQPRLTPAVYRVTALMPNQEFTWVAKLPGATMTAEHRLFQSKGETAVVLSFEIAGLLTKVLEWRYRDLIETYVATEARSLKARCEAG